MRQPVAMRLPDPGVEGLQHIQPLLRDARAHQPAIRVRSLPPDQAHRFHPIQKPRDVRHFAQEPAADFVATQALGRPSQNPQNVDTLSAGDPHDPDGD